MPYGAIATLLSLVLGPIYVLLTEAGPLSKTLVILLLVLGFALGWNSPTWSTRATAGTVLQCAVCVYVLVYIKVSG